MNWEEKRQELDYQHKLEIRRIKYDKLLMFSGAFFSLILTGLLANCIGPKYVAALKREELQQSSDLELRLQQQRLYFEKSIDAHEEVDSLYRNVYTSFGYAVMRAGEAADSTTYFSVFNRYNDDVARLQRSIHYHGHLLQSEYLEATERRLGVFISVRYVDIAEWSKLEPFIEYLYQDSNESMDKVFDSFVPDSRVDRRRTVFPIPEKLYLDFDQRMNQEKAKDYLNRMLTAWKDFMNEQQSKMMSNK